MKKHKITWQNDKGFHWWIATHAGRDKKRWRMKWRAYMLTPEWTAKSEVE